MSWQMLWPFLMVVGANTFYNICAKSTPGNINSLASLSVTYVIAAMVTIGIYFLQEGAGGYFTELTKVNWAVIVLGFVVVFLEFGYIAGFRAGWKVSIFSIVNNITLAVVLLAVGMGLYKESITLRQVGGMLLCGLGLYFINH